MITGMTIQKQVCQPLKIECQVHKSDTTSIRQYLLAILKFSLKVSMKVTEVKRGCFHRYSCVSLSFQTQRYSV